MSEAVCLSLEESLEVSSISFLVVFIFFLLEEDLVECGSCALLQWLEKSFQRQFCLSWMTLDSRLASHHQRAHHSDSL